MTDTILWLLAREHPWDRRETDNALYQSTVFPVTFPATTAQVRDFSTISIMHYYHIHPICQTWSHNPSRSPKAIPYLPRERNARKLGLRQKRIQARKTDGRFNLAPLSPGPTRSRLRKKQIALVSTDRRGCYLLSRRICLVSVAWYRNSEIGRHHSKS